MDSKLTDVDALADAFKMPGIFTRSLRFANYILLYSESDQKAGKKQNSDGGEQRTH